jgi:crossover junction endodeoxyribonuclease RuvC
LTNEINKHHTYKALGIDPGLAATGYAVIGTLKQGGELCAWGSIKTSPQLDGPKRLHRIYTAIVSIIEQWQPNIMAIEDVYVLDRFPKAAIQLGEVRGVVYLAAQQHALEVTKIRPTEIKSCLTGNGRATKEQVHSAVKRILRNQQDITPDHASDATAIALISLSRKGYYTW